MTKERIYYLDFVKALSIFMVVLMHCIDYSASVGSLEWNLCVLMESITKFCIPVFVMTSGVFMLDRDKHISVKSVYFKYVLKFVVAYIFWSGAYSLYSSGLLFNFNVSHIKTLINDFIVGHFHLWYLWMLIGIYITLPFLRKIASDYNILKYFIIVVFLSSSVIPFIDAVTGKNFIAIVDNKLFVNINVYTSMLMIGYFIYKYPYKINKLGNRKFIIIGIICVVITALLTIATKDLETYFEDYMPLNIIYGACVLALMSRVFLPEKHKGIITAVSNNSFGIFLIHVFVIYMYDKLIVFTINSVLGSIVKAIIVFIISFGLSTVIKRIPVIGKYIA